MIQAFLLNRAPAAGEPSPRGLPPAGRRPSGDSGPAGNGRQAGGQRLRLAAVRDEARPGPGEGGGRAEAAAHQLELRRDARSPRLLLEGVLSVSGSEGSNPQISDL